MATLYSLGAVTVKAYRLHTADETNPDSIVTGALVEAEELLEDELRRKLASQERTGTFTIYSDGRIYPDAYPITTATLPIDGRALCGSTPDVTAFIGYFPNDPPNYATVTWTGGYTAGTLPRSLENAVYDLAAGVMAESLVPVGAGSISVGDVSVSSVVSGRGGIDAVVPNLSTRVRRYQNRFL